MGMSQQIRIFFILINHQVLTQIVWFILLIAKNIFINSIALNNSLLILIILCFTFMKQLNLGLTDIKFVDMFNQVFTSQNTLIM